MTIAKQQTATMANIVVRYKLSIIPSISISNRLRCSPRLWTRGDRASLNQAVAATSPFTSVRRTPIELLPARCYKTIYASVVHGHKFRRAAESLQAKTASLPAGNWLLAGMRPSSDIQGKKRLGSFASHGGTLDLRKWHNRLRP
ncbi:hypothetical protein [Allomesorhizobium camelthorni]|uniref:Uncharacterized protein n=1 Tax=Allomesorhizobium camelthorni TaxID=475069 RepID=A0A6G4WNV0_9HYPH|nr:hypothetical protein [Mesorhizobium camelthorni]NGO56058.1 hypothetical protein [Mesorhizobium camelthorni]